MNENTINSLIKILVIIFLLSLSILVILYIKYTIKEKFTGECPNSNEIISLEQWNDKSIIGGFPFQILTFADKNIKTKICVLCAPLYDDDFNRFYRLKNEGYTIIGLCSYGFYPYVNEEDSIHDSRAAQLKNTEMQKIVSELQGWLTCSRTPLPYNVPQLEFSESDCPNINAVSIKGLTKKYDVLYNASSDVVFHEYHKNWILAQKCIKLMNANGLKILVVGRKNIPEDMKLPNIEYVEFLPWHIFIDKIEESKVILVPNISDASPRIITEAICKGTTVLVNKDIFGGWKYVNDNTGEFFTDESDVMNKLNIILSNLQENKYDTRKWFLDNYFPCGVSIKKKELYEFIKKNFL